MKIVIYKASSDLNQYYDTETKSVYWSDEEDDPYIDYLLVLELKSKDNIMNALALYLHSENLVSDNFVATLYNQYIIK